MLNLAMFLANILAEESASVTFVDSFARALQTLGVTGWKAVVVILGLSSLYSYMHGLKNWVLYHRTMRSSKDD